MAFQRPLTYIKLLLAASLFISNTSYLGPGIFEGYQYNDFAHFYVSALRLYTGQQVYGVRLHSDFLAAGFFNDPLIEFATNPPALIALCGPLILLPAQSAFWLWTIGQICLSFYAALCLLRYCAGSVSGNAIAHVVIGVAVSRAFISHIEYGQVQLLLAACLVFGFLLLQRPVHTGTHLMGAALLGATTGLKLFTWPFLFLAWHCGGVRSVAAFAGGLLLVQSVPFVIGGPELFTGFFEYAVPYIQVATMMHSGNVGVPAAFFRLLGTSPALSSWDIWQGPFTAMLQIAAAGFLLYLTGRRSSARCDPSMLFSICICVSLLAAPTVWPHYLVFLLIPAIILCIRIRRRETELAAVCLWGLLALVNGRRITAAPILQTLQVFAAPAGIFCLLLVTLSLGRFDPDVENKTDRTH